MHSQSAMQRDTWLSADAILRVGQIAESGRLVWGFLKAQVCGQNCHFCAFWGSGLDCVPPLPLRRGQQAASGWSRAPACPAASAGLPSSPTRTATRPGCGVEAGTKVDTLLAWAASEGSGMAWVGAPATVAGGKRLGSAAAMRGQSGGMSVVARRATDRLDLEMGA
jgi:hypothetical protein